MSRNLTNFALLSAAPKMSLLWKENFRENFLSVKWFAVEATRVSSLFPRTSLCALSWWNEKKISSRIIIESGFVEHKKFTDPKANFPFHLFSALVLVVVVIIIGFNEIIPVRIEWNLVLRCFQVALEGAAHENYSYPQFYGRLKTNFQYFAWLRLACFAGWLNCLGKVQCVSM